MLCFSKIIQLFYLMGSSQGHRGLREQILIYYPHFTDQTKEAWKSVLRCDHRAELMETRLERGCSSSPSNTLSTLRASQEKPGVRYDELACHIIYQTSCSSDHPLNLNLKPQQMNYPSFSFHLMSPCHHFFKNIWQFAVTSKASVVTAVIASAGNLPACSGRFWWNYCSTHCVLSCSPEWIPLPH